MSERNTLAHALHDIGLAAWFGGSLMGAVGVNGAAADVDDPRQRARVANAGWGRWTPVNLVAIGAHLVGGAQLMKAGDVPVAGGTDSLPTTPPEVAKAQKQLSALQWAIPGLTGAILASSALHEEQQRPSQVVSGVIKGLPSTVSTAATSAALAAKHKVSDVF